MSQEFLELYKQYQSTLIDVYYTKAKHTNLKKVNNNLKKIVESSISIATGKEGNELTDINELEYNIHEFIVLVIYSAYNKTLGIDSARLQKLEFGYVGCTDVIQSLLNIMGVDSTNINQETLETLLSVGREIDYDAYISDELYVNDMENIKDLLDSSRKRIGAKNADLNALIGSTFGKNIKSALSLIRARYDYILEGTFGVDNYKGIYTGSTPAVMQGVSKGTTKVIPPDNDFATQFKPIFDDILDIELCSELTGTNGRQFDLGLIADKASSSVSYKNIKPIYFPYKILEIISKCGLPKDGSFTFTNETQLLNYNKLPSGVVGTKSNYLDNLCKYFEKELIDYIYRCLVNYCTTYFKGLRPSAFESTKEARDNLELYIIDILEDRKNDMINADTNTYGYQSMIDYTLNSIRYFVDCVTTAVVLDKCEVAKTQGYGGSVTQEILEFRIKVCARLTRDNYTNEDFIKSFIEINKLNASDMSNVEKVESVPDEQGFTKIDLKYTFNMEKVNARPTFAYKALQALIEQQSDEAKEAGQAPVSWQNILLGRNLSDRILTSGRDGEVNLQSNQVHWIFSGSRSGKGVMCYNIFSTAIGAGIPIFYIDRKPDTATVMSALCPDMFCVNGGQYDPNIDTQGVFRPDTYNFRIPNYLASYFTDSSNKFDFVYFRSVMLVLAMFDYADTYKDSELGKTLQQAFGGGVLLVLDEFSNFIKDFLARTKPLSASSGSWLSRAYSQKGMVQNLQDVSTGVSKAELNLVKTQNKKNVSDVEIEIAQNNLNVAASKTFDLDKVYWAAIADAYKAIQDSLGGKKDAAGAVAKSMQIFVLGQNLDKVEDCIDNPDWFNTGAAGNMLKFNKSDDIIPLVHLLGGLSSDMITGYQMDRQSYLAQGEKGFKTKDLLNQSRRCFAYKKFGTFSKAELLKISHTTQAFKNNVNEINSYLNSWTYFKPFLILNNAVEPPEEVRYDDFEPDAKKRENIRKGNELYISEDIQRACADSQYVGQCLSNCEAAGLTWDDLLNDNDDGTGHLSQGVGFEGYITQLAGGIPVDSMALSGQLANRFIQEVYGYNDTWRDFVCDFRPEWIVSTKGYSLDGSKNSVQERLNDSFFYSGLLALRPAKVLGEKLESLLPYYAGTETSEIQGVDESIFGEDYNDEVPVMQEESGWGGSDDESWDNAPVESPNQPLSSVEAMRQQMMEDEDDWGDFDTEDEEVEEIPQYASKNYTEADVESLAYQIFGKFTFNHPEIALKIQNPAMKQVVFENCIASARQVLFGGVM